MLIFEALQSGEKHGLRIYQTSDTTGFSSFTIGYNISKSMEGWYMTESGETTIVDLPSEHITVELGDSLSVISQNSGVTLDEIKSLNKLNSDTIFPGQKLKIPATIPQTPESEFEPPPPTTTI